MFGVAEDHGRVFVAQQDRVGIETYIRAGELASILMRSYISLRFAALRMW